VNLPNLGLQNDKLSYNDWLDLFARQNLLKAVELAEKYGLSTMTMDDITKEVRAVRDNAKDNS
jgi:fructosamine-3-kinase